MLASRRSMLLGCVAAAGTRVTNSCTVSAPHESDTPECKLRHVIVVMRHGDRAPVSKSIGPNYPPSRGSEEIWRTKIVSGLTEGLLKGIALSQSNGVDDNIYTGRDVADSPYGQLTNIGADQLRLLGSNLRKKYVFEKKFLPDTLSDEVIYARTMNSLRSLLLGLYGIENMQEIAEHSFPKIQSHPTHHDPMIDGVTTNAEEKATHRKFLFKEHSLPHGFIDFKSVNEKLKRCLGYPDRVNYHVIRENLVCNKSHGLALPEGLDDDDIAQQYEMELWVANILFGDRKYNSHEIGSFMEELRLRLLDIKNGNAKEKLSVYSAHDYTLLPLMIGLDISPEIFPQYASNLKFEIAVWNQSPSLTEKEEKEEILVVRLLWNDEEISLPGMAVWCPVDTLIEKLHAGFLGIEHSSSALGATEDSFSTLNSLDGLDAVLNDALTVGDNKEAQS